MRNDFNDLVRSFPLAGPKFIESRSDSLGDFDLRPTLAKLKMPALVVEGEKTNVPLDSTREWARNPPNARLLLIPDVGHATFIGKPGVLPGEIETFLQGGWPASSKPAEKS